MELYKLSNTLEGKGDTLGSTAAYLEALSIFLSLHYFIFIYLFLHITHLIIEDIQRKYRSFPKEAKVELQDDGTLVLPIQLFVEIFR